MVTLEIRHLSGSERARIDDRQGPGFHHGNALFSLRLPGIHNDLLEPLDCLDRITFLGLKGGCDLELRMGRRLGAGELADRGFPSGGGFVEFLLLGEAPVDLEQGLRHTRIERVVADKCLPGSAGPGVLFVAEVIRSNQQANVKNGAPGGGRLGTVRDFDRYS